MPRMSKAQATETCGSVDKDTPQMLTPTSSATISGTLDRSSDTAMSIDPAGMAHVMSVLTNLYSDKNLAVLREYSTNAADSHVAAGTDRPIQVTLPSPLNPTLMIRDYGVGLSELELTEVYARYGASTKRDTNTLVGSFGLGCKSAFTLGEQFVVTAVQRNRKTVALFAVNDAGIGTMNVAARADTDEPDGVLVSIGIRDVATMIATARRFFATWRPGTVLVDGHAPTSAYDDGIALANDLYIRGAREDLISGAVVVMGNVGYPVGHGLLCRIRHGRDDEAVTRMLNRLSGSALLISTAIGSVDITPSREGLRDTPRTVAVIQDALTRASAELSGYTQKLISTAPSLTHAAMTLAETEATLRKVGAGLHSSDLKWRGQELATDVAVDLFLYQLGQTRGGWICSEAAPPNTANHLQISDLPNALVVTGVPAGRSIRSAARRYLIAKASRKLRIFASPTDTGSVGWFSYGGSSPVPTIDYNTFLAQAKAVDVPFSQRAQASYQVLLPDDMSGPMTMAVSDIAALECPVMFWTQVDDRQNYFAGQAEQGNAVVLLSTRQTGSAFCRRVPNAIDGVEVATRLAAEFNAGLSTDETDLLHLWATGGDDRPVADKIRTIFGHRMDHIEPGCALGVHLARLAEMKVAVSSDSFRAVAARARAAHRWNKSGPVSTPSGRGFVAEHLPLLHMLTQSWYSRGCTPAGWDHLLAYINSIPALTPAAANTSSEPISA